MSKKKRMGKASNQSKGERRTVSLSNRVHKDERMGYQFNKQINKLKAWAVGKRAVVKVPSVDNPSILEKVDANQVWGHWRGQNFENKRKENQ